MKVRCESVLPHEESAYLAAQIRRHEGLRLGAYLDGEGLLTVGYGHNCTAWPVDGVSKPDDKISREQAEILFKNDLALAEAQAVHALPCIRNLRPARAAVIINMVFNMGIGSTASGRGVMGFRRMIAALQAGDYKVAAREMLDSRWARQVGRRAAELSRQMESGEWPD